jgi:hypothetical protein
MSQHWTRLDVGAIGSTGRAVVFAFCSLAGTSAWCLEGDSQASFAAIANGGESVASANAGAILDPHRIGPGAPIGIALGTAPDFARLSPLGPATLAGTDTSGTAAGSFRGGASKAAVEDYGYRYRERHGGWLGGRDGDGDGGWRHHGHCDNGDWCGDGGGGAPLPEPGSMALMAGGALAAWLLVRARQRGRATRSAAAA